MKFAFERDWRRTLLLRTQTQMTAKNPKTRGGSGEFTVFVVQWANGDPGDNVALEVGGPAHRAVWKGAYAEKRK